MSALTATAATRADISHGLDIANPQAALLTLARWLRREGQEHAALDLEALARKPDEAARRIAYLSDQVDDLEYDLEASREECSRLKKDCDDLEDEAKALGSEVEDLEGEAAVLERRLVELRAVKKYATAKGLVGGTP